MHRHTYGLDGFYTSAMIVEKIPPGTAVLGPLQAMWDAWTSVQSQVKWKDFAQFAGTMDIQFEEALTHQTNGERDRAANEIVDCISVALNALRWLGYTQPEEVAELLRLRAITRYEGQTQAILSKYQKQYGL